MKNHDRNRHLRGNWIVWLVLLILLGWGLAFCFRVYQPIAEQRRWYFRVRSALESLRAKRPPDVSRER